MSLKFKFTTADCNIYKITHQAFQKHTDSSVRSCCVFTVFSCRRMKRVFTGEVLIVSCIKTNTYKRPSI